jgi:hypothetical protein
VSQVVFVRHGCMVSFKEVRTDSSEVYITKAEVEERNSFFKGRKLDFESRLGQRLFRRKYFAVHHRLCSYILGLYRTIGHDLFLKSFLIHNS